MSNRRSISDIRQNKIKIDEIIENYRHCPDCGAVRNVKFVPAEQYEFMGTHPYSKYSIRTGDEQYIIELHCPNRKWWHWTKHMKCQIEEVMTKVASVE